MKKLLFLPVFFVACSLGAAQLNPTTFNWEQFSTGTLLTSTAVGQSDHGYYTSHYNTGNSGTQDIQAPSWGGKAMRLDQDQVDRGMAGNTKTAYSTSNGLIWEARCGTQDRVAVTLLWDGLIATGFEPHPKNGYTFQNRPAVNEARITRWLNGGFSVLDLESYTTPNQNNFTMKCTISSAGDMELYLNGALICTASDANHTSGGWSVFAYSLSDTFVDDIVISDFGEPAADGRKLKMTMDF